MVEALSELSSHRLIFGSELVFERSKAVRFNHFAGNPNPELVLGWSEKHSGLFSKNEISERACFTEIKDSVLSGNPFQLQQVLNSSDLSPREIAGELYFHKTDFYRPSSEDIRYGDTPGPIFGSLDPMFEFVRHWNHGITLLGLALKQPERHECVGVLIEAGARVPGTLRVRKAYPQARAATSQPTPPWEEQIQATINDYETALQKYLDDAPNAHVRAVREVWVDKAMGKNLAEEATEEAFSLMEKGSNYYNLPRLIHHLCREFDAVPVDLLEEIKYQIGKFADDDLNPAVQQLSDLGLVIRTEKQELSQLVVTEKGALPLDEDTTARLVLW